MKHLVFVTVGSTGNDFQRLLSEIDVLIERGILSDVVAQIGKTTYTPRNFKHFPFLSYDQLLRYIEDAELVIAHTGTGTLNMCLGLRKKIIAVPRLKKYHEHPDDHQLELGALLQAENRILFAQDICELENLIQLSRSWKPRFKEVATNGSLLAFIEKTVAELIDDKTNRKTQRKKRRSK